MMRARDTGRATTNPTAGAGAPAARMRGPRQRVGADSGLAGDRGAADRRRRGGAAQAQSRAFSPGWFADKGAAQSAVQRSGRLPDGSLAGVGNASQQQAQSRQQLQRSLDNLNRTAAAVAAQQAAQAAARGGGRQWRRRAGRTDAGRPVGGRGRAGQMGKAPRRRRRARPMAARS